MGDIKFDKSKFPLKNEIFLRKEELGEIIVRERAERRSKELAAVARKRRLTRVYAYCTAMIVMACIMYAAREVTVTGGLDGNRLVLPCGSVVMLDEGGTLSYRPNLWHVMGRKVELESGEAQFYVTKGDGFVVSTDVGDVSVLGTTFDVSVYPDSMKVKCHSGKVKLIPASDEDMSLILTEGEEAIVTRVDVKKPELKIVEKSIIEEEMQPIYYNAAPLMDVIEDIERVFGITVVNSQLCRNEKYTGVVYPDDMNLSLDMVFGSCGFEYEMSSDEITISRIK